MDQLKINEIFFSIQGESTFSGWPTVFVRTSGCHLRCSYCDTKYAYYEGKLMTRTSVLEEVSSYNCSRVCLTGGEPLLQKASFGLMTELCNLGYVVSLETSGDLSCLGVDYRVKKIVDVKTPGSKTSLAFCRENLHLKDDVNTEFKFVICSEEDFDWAEEFVRNEKLNGQAALLYSPSFGQVSEKWLADKILSQKSPARLQLQLHKYIWSPSERGV